MVNNEITLRDYFAGQAVNALLQKTSKKSNIVREAYVIADIMLHLRTVPSSVGYKDGELYAI